MVIGEVTFIHKRKKYGFIEIPNDADDYFFYLDETELVSPDEIDVGTTVSFTREEGERGPKATNIELPEGDQGRTTTTEEMRLRRL